MDKRQTRAFEEFAAESGAELLRIATLLTPDPHTAEDVYQETLQRLAARWSRVDNPKAFCRRVMHNIVVDQKRARARRPHELRLHDTGDTTDPRSADPHHSVELWPSLRAALDSLTVQQRTVLVLRYFDDRSEAEVAGCSASPSGPSRAQARAPSPTCVTFLAWPPSSPPPTACCERTDNACHR